jgi:hypothetical protein
MDDKTWALVERLHELSALHEIFIKTADTIEELLERCEDYKDQVKHGDGIIEAQDKRIEELRSVLLRLADAADDVGVHYFDTDTMSPEVEEMQKATLEARALAGKEA